MPEKLVDNPPRWLSGAVLALVVFLIISLVVKVPYTVETSHEIQAPYEVEEKYVETVPVEREEPMPLSYRLGSSSTFDCGDVADYKQCILVPIENTDEVGGTFKLHCKAKVMAPDNNTTVKKELTDWDSEYIEAGKRATIECGPFDVEEFDNVVYTKTVSPDTKPVMVAETEDFVRTRTVTKYRTETIIETQTEYRTLLKHLILRGR